MKTKSQVKWFNAHKGFGFLGGPQGKDVFVHYSQIQTDGFKELKEKQWVEYNLVEGEKGLYAENVSRILENISDNVSEDTAKDSKSDPPQASSGYTSGD